jgi:hypothetical protein
MLPFLFISCCCSLCTVYNLPIMYSDHAPILTISNRPLLNLRKLLNLWLFESDFQATAQTAWSSSCNKPFHLRTSKLACSLKRWSRTKRPLQQQLDSIHAELDAVQSTPIHLLEQLSLINMIKLWQNQVNIIDRAKRHCVVHGNKNTT